MIVEKALVLNIFPHRMHLKGMFLFSSDCLKSLLAQNALKTETEFEMHRMHQNPESLHRVQL